MEAAHIRTRSSVPAAENPQIESHISQRTAAAVVTQAPATGAEASLKLPRVKWTPRVKRGMRLVAQSAGTPASASTKSPATAAAASDRGNGAVNAVNSMAAAAIGGLTPASAGDMSCAAVDMTVPRTMATIWTALFFTVDEYVVERSEVDRRRHGALQLQLRFVLVRSMCQETDGQTARINSAQAACHDLCTRR